MPSRVTSCKRRYSRSEPPDTLLQSHLGEWLLDPPSGEFTRFILELMERRHDTASAIFCTQYKQSDWHARLGTGALADAIMDHVVHNMIWVETGGFNMREADSDTGGSVLEYRKLGNPYLHDGIFRPEPPAGQPRRTGGSERQQRVAPNRNFGGSRTCEYYSAAREDPGSALGASQLVSLPLHRAFIAVATRKLS